jgi:hypothetical protein
MMKPRSLVRCLLGMAVLAAGACGPAVDLTTGVQLESFTTGWTEVEARAAGGGNKLVPAVSFKLKNASDQTLAPLQVNAIFRRVDDQKEWSNAMITAAGSAGLPPTGSTAQLVIKGQLGYTGTDPQWDMLHNSHFVDAKVDLFARYASQQWTHIGEYAIARQIIER